MHRIGMQTKNWNKFYRANSVTATLRKPTKKKEEKKLEANQMKGDN